MTPDRMIETILRREGGFVDHPEDRGGPTNMGITLTTLRSYNPAATIETLKNLGAEDARRIYRFVYLEPFMGIPDEGVRALLFDSAVQHGVKRAVEMLQKAVGAVPDGILGPKTLAAVMQNDPDDLWREVLAARLQFYGRLITRDPSQAVFAAGWMNRMAELLKEAE